MKPKVFVSSTYYDLKHIRENIEKMLDNMNLDSILFESSDIYFEHGKPLDMSCYQEVFNCNMMVLIVGGRYGSEATGSDFDEFVDEYETSYISITNKEYLVAKKIGIPIYVFVDNNVHVEYESYKKNRAFFNSSKDDYKFAYVDSKNVFEFISTIYKSGVAIYKFQKFDDIEVQFRNQVSGMLFNYLEELKVRKNADEVKQSVGHMENLIKKMEKMIQSIGEKVLEDEVKVLNTVKYEQKVIEIKHLADTVSRLFYFSDHGTDLEYKELAKLISTDEFISLMTMKCDFPEDSEEAKAFENEKWEQIDEFLNNNFPVGSLDFDSLDSGDLESEYYRLKELIGDSSEFKDVYINALAVSFKDNSF